MKCFFDLSQEESDGHKVSCIFSPGLIPIIGCLTFDPVILLNLKF